MTINKTSGDKITFADIVAEFGTPVKTVDGEEVKIGSNVGVQSHQGTTKER